MSNKKAPKGVYRIGAPGSDEERILVIYPISGELLMPVREYLRHGFEPPAESLPQKASADDFGNDG
jgi:hypothetical protein